jgi:formylglycine-generating enzyme required for sulfatase activity
VAELYKEPVRREFATALFNGYGTELNVFAPGDPHWVEEQYRFLGRCSRILREHRETFTGGRLTPLIPTSRDDIWVNRWEDRGKTLYTLFSLMPEGCRDTLFSVPADTGVHYVDLWNHREVQPVIRGRERWLPVFTDPFDKALLGSNGEGASGCIAGLARRLRVRREGDRLHVSADGGTRIRVWAGHPSYDRKAYEWKGREGWISLFQTFGGYEGDFVVQLFDDAGELIDERIESLPPGKPRRISHPIPSPSGALAADSMLRIPAGSFRFRTSHGDGFIPYPEEGEGEMFRMPSFLMDRFPVTNRQFKRFLDASGYRPSDTTRFLMLWKDGEYPSGQADHPVVHVSLEDAKAYAAWAGKRLPTELEWQYAAQTGGGLEWPWRQEQPVTRTEERITETLTVKTIQGIDPSRCNLGDGASKPVGSYPMGANPFGLQDLTGAVWQLTQDEYRAGRYRYVILKGGSFFKPSSSWWYIQGGPRELHYRQHLLRVSQGFERNETVGFRCVRDLSSE